MVVDTDTSNLHEMLQKALRWLRRQISNNERVRLNVGDELLLLFEDVFEVVEVTLRIRLVHKLPYETLLRQLSQLLNVTSQFVVA